jgi:hypothetical protein
LFPFWFIRDLTFGTFLAGQVSLKKACPTVKAHNGNNRGTQGPNARFPLAKGVISP